MAKEPTKRQIVRAEKILRGDILWAVKYGPGFDGARGARFMDGRWTASLMPWEERPCGVCAIGSVCLSQQPRPRRAFPSLDGISDVVSAAAVLRLPRAFTWSLYGAVSEAAPGRLRRKTWDEKGPYTPTVWSLARRLRRYGDKLMEKRDELRHEAAQEDQLIAEKLGLDSSVQRTGTQEGK
jgi:hypothetical protein